MSTLVTLVHAATCLFLILLILLQSGKGADISASLGGSSQTVFGSSGGANFFTRTTAILAAIFFCTSITLTVFQAGSKKSLFDVSQPIVPVTTPGKPAAPVVPATPDTAPAQAAPAAPAPTSAK